MIHTIQVPIKYNLKSFNFYLIKQANSLTLIDAGVTMDACWEHLQATLSANGLKVEDITEIIITHNHEDHVGLINRIQEIKSVPIYAHEEAVIRLNRDKDYFNMRLTFFEQLYREMDCGEAGTTYIKKLADTIKKRENDRIIGTIIPIKDNDIISGLRVIETPGHSPDHIVLLEESQKILFSGDHLVGHISSNAIIEPDTEGKRIQTVSHYVNSLNKCLSLDMDKAYAGHGDVIPDPKTLLEHRIKRIYEKSDLVLQYIQDGFVTGSSIAKQMYKKKYESEFSLVMSEIIGHLDFLEGRNKIAKEWKNHYWQYYVI